MPRPLLSRRTLLRATGVSIALPWLEAMSRRSARADEGDPKTPPKRLVLIGRSLGLHGPYFFPETTGRDYEPSRYLKLLEPHRRDLTVFSGMSHHYGSGHGTRPGLMTGVAPHRMRQGDVRNSISLDREVAEQWNAPTRFNSLVLGASGLSWNRKGVMIPAEGRATEVFRRLFVSGTEAEITRELERLENGRSILDGVREQARGLAGQVGPADRDRLDLFLTSVREAERRLQQDQDWVLKPKPRVDVEPFTNDYPGTTLIERERQWFDLVRLALQTDSTRVVSLNVYSHANVSVDGQVIAHHEASHHGRRESAIERLATIEEAELNAFGEFLTKMKQADDGGVSLLDRTQVLYAGDLGNASAHTTSNLPVLLAGGGLRHAGHVAFDTENNELMSNLFVRMLQQAGIETESFGNSSRTLNEV